MMDTIEEKIMSLQSQLQEVRQQRETGNLPSTVTAAPPHSTFAGRGRGRGREIRGRGRAMRGRGRGRFVSNKSLDLRSKSLILTDAPAGLTQSAHQHFSRSLPPSTLPAAPSSSSSPPLFPQIRTRAEDHSDRQRPGRHRPLRHEKRRRERLQQGRQLLGPEHEDRLVRRAAGTGTRTAAACWGQSSRRRRSH
jgi:hypothetical protein